MIRAFILTLCVPALAQAAEPVGYGAFLLSSTMAYRPAGEKLGGPAGDLSPSFGLGWLATETISLEVDVGPTFADGGYVGAAVVPAVVWSFHSHGYLAGRLLIALDPETAVVAMPGVGGIYVTESGFAPVLELSALVAPVEGKVDLGASLTAGVLYFF